MDQYVIYNIKYHVLICRQCGFAIPPNWMLRHLREFHKTIPLETRQAIVAYANSLQLCQPDKADRIYELIKPIDGLTITNGLECQYEYCGKLRGTEISMKQHCRNTHKWIETNEVMWKKQAFQTFFNGQHRK